MAQAEWFCGTVQNIGPDEVSLDPPPRGQTSLPALLAWLARLVTTKHGQTMVARARFVHQHGNNNN